VKRFSLRRRLTALTLAALLAVWAGMAAVSYYGAREEARGLSDARLQEGARALLELDPASLRRLAAGGRRASRSGHDDEEEHEEHGAERRIAFQIWQRDGALRYQSPGAPAAPFDATPGFATVRAEGDMWRTVALWNQPEGFQVRVFERAGIGEALAVGVAARMTMPLLAALPVLAVLVWLGIGRGLAPLGALARALTARGAANLEPVALDRVPVEAEPVLQSVNDLLQRLARALDNERRFTADAAHELRTPLAAIKVQAEVARGARDAQERERSLAGIVAGVGRTTHLVEQLLTLARAEALDPRLLETIDVAELVARRAGVHAESALRREIELGVSAGPGCVVRGAPTMLEALVDNLLENAIRYTQEGGRVEVSVARNGDFVALSVRDNGPGLVPEARARMFDRFYRGPGGDAPGSGLGLSIVERIAAAHGAAIEAGPGIGSAGLGVSLRFRAAGASGPEAPA
jgi:two-component system sensor histidine kinase QseC